MMLNSEQVEKLRGMMATAGWREVFEPVVAGKMEEKRKLAFMLPSERPKPYSELDDATAVTWLRGEGAFAEWVLHVFRNEVTVHDLNRRRAEQMAAENDGKPVEP